MLARLGLGLVALLLIGGCKDKEEEKAADPVPAPTLSLLTPAQADWLSEGVHDASGTATDVTEVTVNGGSAVRKGTEFSADVKLERGVSVVEALATGTNGDQLFVRHGVIAGDYADPDDAVTGAMKLRVNQSGLDEMSSLVATYIEPTLLNDTVAAMNPVYEDSYGIWGWDAVTIAADITSVSFSPAQVSIGPKSGQLELVAAIPDFWVDARAYGEAIGYDFDSTVNMAASEVTLTATVSVGADDGKIVVALSGVSVVFQDFTYDTSLLPGDIESYILVETIQTTIEEMLVTQIQEMVPPLLEETLGGLAPTFSTELLGEEIELEYAFSDVRTDDDGLAIVLDMDVAIDGDGDKSYKGYLSAPKSDAEVDTHADLAGAISDDFMNLALFQAWRAGMLDMTLSTQDGSLDSFLLAPFHATEGSITVRTDLPPVLIERDGALLAQVAELIVTVDTADSDLGSHLVVAVAAEVPLDVSLEDAALALDIGDPALTLVVRESDWGASNEATTKLVEDTLPLELLLGLLGNISFDLPTLLGVSFADGEAERDEGGFHTLVTVDMEVE